MLRLTNSMLLAAGLVFGLAACTTADMGGFTDDHGSALFQMTGHGSLGRTPDGSDTFRWLVPANAYDGLIPAEQHEAQREYALQRWLGKQDACPGGHEVSSRSEEGSMLVYEGRCL